MDHFWQTHTKTSVYKVPESLAEAEMYKRNTCWNIINEPIDRTHVLNQNVSISNTVYEIQKGNYGQFMLCINNQPDIEHIFIMQFVRWLDSGSAQYKLIGCNKVWGEPLRLEAFVVIQDGRQRYIPFDSDDVHIEMLYLAVHDGGDLSGFDSRYNFSNHASTYFCTCCHEQEKNQVLKSNSHRTLLSILVDANT